MRCANLLASLPHCVIAQNKFRFEDSINPSRIHTHVSECRLPLQLHTYNCAKHQGNHAGTW